MTPLHQAPDADDEPTLWQGPTDHPTAVLRRCENPVAFDALVAVIGVKAGLQGEYEDRMREVPRSWLSEGELSGLGMAVARLEEALTPATRTPARDGAEGGEGS